MPNFIDLTGKRFGRVIVLNKKSNATRQNSIAWECKCDCGKICLKSASNLRSGKSTSCGCFRKEIMSETKLSDLKKINFGNLTVDSRVGTTKNGRAIWRCLCNCGNYINISSASLKRGLTKSCGCLRKDKRTSRVFKNSIHNTFIGYRSRANRKGIEFGISEDYLSKMLLSDCFYCQSSNYKMSIDRMNSQKGYTVENSVPCCVVCNYGKGALSHTEYLDHLDRIHSLKQAPSKIFNQKVKQLTEVEFNN